MIFSNEINSFGNELLTVLKNTLDCITKTTLDNFGFTDKKLLWPPPISSYGSIVNTRSLLIIWSGRLSIFQIYNKNPVMPYFLKDLKERNKKYNMDEGHKIFCRHVSIIGSTLTRDIAMNFQPIQERQRASARGSYLKPLMFIILLLSGIHRPASIYDAKTNSHKTRVLD